MRDIRITVILDGDAIELVNTYAGSKKAEGKALHDGSIEWEIGDVYELVIDGEVRDMQLTSAHELTNGTDLVFREP